MLLDAMRSGLYETTFYLHLFSLPFYFILLLVSIGIDLHPSIFTSATVNRQQSKPIYTF